tara:strand:+ start:714 stop:896 length:183 start_codon:yes stop_codon:yes gene_type:complete
MYAIAYALALKHRIRKVSTSFEELEKLVETSDTISVISETMKYAIIIDEIETIVVIVTLV